MGSSRVLALERLRASERLERTPTLSPEHTALAREAVGDKLVAPEQTVILETDPDKARAAGREFLSMYVGLPNYTNNLRTLLGFEDSDFDNDASDRLVDAVIAWGDESAIKARLDAHFDAGAHHICIQVPAPWETVPMDTLRALAPTLTALNA